jgi:hypothetical protein
MSLRDKLKHLTTTAETTATEHKQQLQHTIHTATALADKRTGGKCHNQLAKAATKTEKYLERRAAQEPQPPQHAGSHPADTRAR